MAENKEPLKLYDVVRVIDEWDGAGDYLPNGSIGILVHIFQPDKSCNVDFGNHDEGRFVDMALNNLEPVEYFHISEAGMFSRTIPTDPQPGKGQSALMERDRLVEIQQRVENPKSWESDMVEEAQELLREVLRLRGPGDAYKSILHKRRKKEQDDD